MLNFIVKKIIGTQNQRQLKKIMPLVAKINSFEGSISKLTDSELRLKTDEFRARINEKSKMYKDEIGQLEAELVEVATPDEKERLRIKLRDFRNIIFEDVLPEAFAVVREAGRRTINMRHFDVQLIGGVILHHGKISEMATGEGKTLVATLPAYLNGLLGKGVHVVTVNDYLAKRDREWMGPIYELLGLSIGVIQHDMEPQERQVAYGCDITYGTNNEFGFDYLRDNMVINKSDMVQRGHFYAIVDEVDSILIDEARTPLIISGAAEESTEKYYTAQNIAGTLKGRRITEKDEINAKYKGEDLYKGVDYIADEKAQTVSISEVGEEKISKFFGVENLHQIDTMEYRHHAIQALRAKEFFERDVDYVIKDGEVIIVDEFTGRLMPGRRWSDGLHQAVEAKEGMKIERENQTLATITFQNYFRMYEKLSGMTGTAMTEAMEFKEIYKLDVVTIPPNRTLIRTNYPDRIYRSQKEKFNAVVEEIQELNKIGRPVLVGTISIEKSEYLSELLKRKGVPHQVLNAKYHELEAQIVSQAGRFKTVTIATNMAGRGTDILLGGNADYMAKSLLKENKDSQESDIEKHKQVLEKFKSQVKDEHEKVVSLGGLHILGTERHESRRIDNQLRGRSGRQGDPGSSRFYVALEDELMRLFGSEKLIGIMNGLGLEEGQVIEHPWVSRSIEVAQKRVENHNFEIRKQLLEYDNVMNKQREVIYSQRKMVLNNPNLKDYVLDMLLETVEAAVGRFMTENEFDMQGLISWLKMEFSVATETKELESISRDDVQNLLYEKIKASYDSKESMAGEAMRHLERMVLLQIIDTKWKDHLRAMDELREGIGLRAYGQRDPLIEYQREAFLMFGQMVDSIKQEAVDVIFKIQAVHTEKFKSVFGSAKQEFLHPERLGFTKPIEVDSEEDIQKPTTKQAPAKSGPKVGRNDPCPCGSGKKYKKCCGR